MIEKEMNEYQQMLNKYYDIQITTHPDPNQFSIFHLINLRTTVYRHAKLVNVNGWGTGQVHFITDDGSYMVVPWCYIISMLPAKGN